MCHLHIIMDVTTQRELVNYASRQFMLNFFVDLASIVQVSKIQK